MGQTVHASEGLRPPSREPSSRAVWGRPATSACCRCRRARRAQWPTATSTLARVNRAAHAWCCRRPSALRLRSRQPSRPRSHATTGRSGAQAVRRRSSGDCAFPCPRSQARARRPPAPRARSRIESRYPRTVHPMDHSSAVDPGAGRTSRWGGEPGPAPRARCPFAKWRPEPGQRRPRFERLRARPSSHLHAHPGAAGRAASTERAGLGPAVATAPMAAPGCPVHRRRFPPAARCGRAATARLLPHDLPTTYGQRAGKQAKIVASASPPCAWPCESERRRRRYLVAIARVARTAGSPGRSAHVLRRPVWGGPT